MYGFVEIIENKVKVKANQHRTISKENQVEIDIAFAIPKGKRSHLLTQKCTELGVHKLIPIDCERSVVKLKTDSSAKIEKWQKIAIEASKQCGRNTIPEICEIVDFKKIIKSLDSYDLPLFACNQSNANNLKNTLLDYPNVNNTIIFIGPEGGFTPKEIEMAMKAGCKLVRLSQRTLRVETAAIAVSAILSFHYCT